MRRTTESFKEEMKVINPKIEILGEYVKVRTKIKCKCKIDGHEWETIPEYLLKGIGCPKCGGKLRKTHSEFVEEMKVINRNIEILGEYVNSRIRIKCRCRIDGYEWSPLPNNLLKGSGCPKCRGVARKSHSEFVELVSSMNQNIEILGKYTDTMSKIKCRCKIDGYEWSPLANNLLKGSGCPKCGGMVPKPHETFVEEMKAINPNVEILGKYVTASTKIKCRCKIDGYEWESTPNNLLQKHGCPKCAVLRRNSVKSSKKL